ncbi:MAG: rhomboid family intramembrane serine protease [Desulfuromonas sp.]|uniref:rhomboid family intramembrane serine protease n=1 Tax=Desulfuromonas sp. TaxID=892 RepID=UPI000CB3A3B3|nr:rhomboid family intramembrane serine protease [Desulfuromonas sp.]PLX82534.1 MAG: rhomboid family intramembrane serine protease [Desulfuromonas sp.]
MTWENEIRPNDQAGPPPAGTSSSEGEVLVSLQTGERTGRALSSQVAETWSLVLTARDVPHRVQRCGWGREIFVAPTLRERARRELRLYEGENRNWPPTYSKTVLADNTLATLSALLLLGVFHNLTILQEPALGGAAIDWVRTGNADAGKILDGQWWRLVTALTLHADGRHLLGNLLIGGFFIVRLCREVGSGLGWSLLLLSGLLGNLINAHMQDLHHRSVGLSTAVFGAVGLLAALSVMRHRRSLRSRWPLPLAAAAALLGLLGTSGENTDLGAHLFGFVAGLGLGMTAGAWLKTRGLPSPFGNALLAVAALALTLGAWLAAFQNPG